MKSEAKLKSAFFQALIKQLPGFYVLHHATRAAPDYAIVGNKFTSMWEFKHGTPQFESKADQELMCMRLAAAGYCRYVIWSEDQQGRGQRTLVVHPRNLHERQQKGLNPEAFTMGYDHAWLVRYISKVHGC